MEILYWCTDSDINSAIEEKELFNTVLEKGQSFDTGLLKNLDKSSIFKYNVLTRSNEEIMSFRNIFETFYIKENKYRCFYDIENRNIIVKQDDVEICTISQVFEHGNYFITAKSIIDYILASLEKIEKVKEKAKNFKPKTVILEDSSEFIIENIEGDIKTKFEHLSSLTSELTTSINKQINLIDTEELSRAFIEARRNIEKLSNTKIGFKSTLNALTDKLPFSKKIKNSVKETIANNKSVQSNIDYLFGLIHEKYEVTIQVGEKLQKSKAQFVAQIKSLEDLLVESNEILNKYDSKADIPMKDISINTQIKTNIEKNKIKLQKIDGAILAVQATIISLGSKLPSHKADLEDEMAIGGLLTSIDNYQEMYKEITELVSEVTKTTAEKTHAVIENLMNIQIEDTHTTKYLADSINRGEKFAAMLVDKSDKLAAKVTRDAKFISEIAKGNTLNNAKKKFPLE